MQSLLRWSLEHSEPQGPNPAREVKPIDPGIIDMILGRPDSELMKEDVAVATDESKPEEERIAALDHLEMVGLPLLVLNFADLVLIARRKHRQCQWCVFPCSFDTSS